MKRSRAAPGASKRASAKQTDPSRTAAPRGAAALAARVVRELDAIERRGGDGTLDLGAGLALPVTNLAKSYFPDAGLTKGDLLRYYARVSPVLLPAIADRPLALRRHPGGVNGASFYQQDPGPHAPDAARTATVETEQGTESRLVGGDLFTLLYTVQIGTIAVNPWHARVGSLRNPDYAVIDLDPGEGVPFRAVAQAARWVHDVLEEIDLVGVAKTSGSRGMHVAIPLGTTATWSDCAAIAAHVAQEVASRHPKHATVQRALKARPTGTIYMDHLQNAYGKTLASVLSARATGDARVSMPLSWRQVTAALDAGAFTIATVPKRLAATKRVWAPLVPAPARRNR